MKIIRIFQMNTLPLACMRFITFSRNKVPSYA